MSALAAMFVLLSGIFLSASAEAGEPPTQSAKTSAAKNKSINKGKDTMTLVVTASAYTSSVAETDSTPTLAAWGDVLKPGMKVIAVSKDLLAMGLRHNTKVTIDGLTGEYVVLDRMPAKWRRKIDIYMGNDRNKALRWGKRKVTIHWRKRH